ncbi:MAG: hypothetical protein NVS3B14_19230 [Ktedonobacteraceae bacterium]
MNPSVVQYVGFIVAVLILTWAVIEINRRYFRGRGRKVKSLNTWIHLETGQHEATEESLPAGEADEEADDTGEQSMQTRARQNGHYSESKKPL